MMMDKDLARKSDRGKVGRPKSEMVSEIDTKIIDVALDNFIRHGYSGASMSVIIREANISATTLYSRYSSKYDLFNEIVTRQIADFSKNEGIDYLDEVYDVKEGLKIFANYVLDTILRGRAFEVNKLMHSELPRFPELSPLYWERNRLGKERIESFLHKCASKGDFSYKDPGMVADTLVLIIGGLYFRSVMSNEKVSKSEIDSSVDVFCKGMDSW